MATPNLAIPHIAASQNQKEVTANTAFDDFDTVMCGSVSIDISGSADITPSPSLILEVYTLKLTGVLTGNISLILPINRRQYRIQHAATDASIGDYTVTVKCSGQPGIVVQEGETRLLYCNGTDIEELDTKIGKAPSIVTAPVSATASGHANQIAFDATHFYVCIATNTWVRATLATF